MSVQTKVASCGITLTICLLLLGCSVATPLTSDLSPNGKLKVEVKFEMLRGNPAKDGTVDIFLLEEGKAPRRVYVDGQDRRPRVIQTVWSKNSRIFGVLEIDQLTTDIRFAYDTVSDRQIPADIIMSDIDVALIRRYGLEEYIQKNPSFDPKIWVREQAAEGKIQIFPSSLWEAEN